MPEEKTEGKPPEMLELPNSRMEGEHGKRRALQQNAADKARLFRASEGLAKKPSKEACEAHVEECKQVGGQNQGEEEQQAYPQSIEGFNRVERHALGKVDQGGLVGDASEDHHIVFDPPECPEVLATIRIRGADDLLVEMKNTRPGEQNAEQHRDGSQLEEPAPIVMEIFQRLPERCRPALEPGLHGQQHSNGWAFRRTGGTLIG